VLFALMAGAMYASVIASASRAGFLLASLEIVAVLALALGGRGATLRSIARVVAVLAAFIVLFYRPGRLGDVVEPAEPGRPVRRPAGDARFDARHDPRSSWRDSASAPGPLYIRRMRATTTGCLRITPTTTGRNGPPRAASRFCAAPWHSGLEHTAGASQPLGNRRDCGLPCIAWWTTRFRNLPSPRSSSPCLPCWRAPRRRQKMRKMYLDSVIETYTMAT